MAKGLRCGLWLLVLGGAVLGGCQRTLFKDTDTVTSRRVRYFEGGEAATGVRDQRDNDTASFGSRGY